MALSGSKLAQELVRKSLALHKKLSRVEKDKLRAFPLAYQPEESLFFVLPTQEHPRMLTFAPIPETDEEQDPSEPSLEFLLANPILGFSMDPVEKLPEEWLKYLKRGGFQASPQSLAPYLFTQRLHRTEPAKGTKQLRLFLFLLNSVLNAIKAGVFEIPDDKNDLVTVRAWGEPSRPKVSVATLSELRKEQNLPEAGGREARPWEGRKGLPADLVEWKEIDRRVTEMIISCVPESDLDDPELLSLFFGSEEEADEALAWEEGMALDAYHEWLALDYKPDPGGEAAWESLLEEDLDPRERALLEARAAAAPSFYKVEWIEKGKYLVLADLFTGETFTVWDISLSETAEEGTVLAGRIYRAGNYSFLASFGPPLSQPALDRTLEALQKMGMKFNPRDMKEKSHLFGRIFAPVHALYESLKAGPALHNTDGDPLVFFTAAFEVGDLEALRKTLDGREDMKPSGKGQDDWIWTRELPPDSPMIGDSLHLGRIRVVGDEVLLEVNSEERYKTGRKILESIPGISIRSLTKKPFSKETMENLPLDDRLPSPESKEPLSEESRKEIRKAIKEEFRKFYMKWLDQPIPALGNKTPRQACATEEGRQRVAALIRTIPPSSGPGGISIPAPKKEMLKELGLDEQAMEQG